MLYQEVPLTPTMVMGEQLSVSQQLARAQVSYTWPLGQLTSKDGVGWADIDAQRSQGSGQAEALSLHNHALDRASGAFISSRSVDEGREGDEKEEEERVDTGEHDFAWLRCVNPESFLFASG